MVSVPSCHLSTSHITRTLARNPVLFSEHAMHLVSADAHPLQGSFATRSELKPGVVGKGCTVRGRLLDEAPRARGVNAQGSRRLIDSASRPGPEGSRPRRQVHCCPQRVWIMDPAAFFPAKQPFRGIARRGHHRHPGPLASRRGMVGEGHAPVVAVLLASAKASRRPVRSAEVALSRSSLE
jgi:hypothetical protein